MRKCLITGTPLNIHNMVTTTDGNSLHKSVYDEICLYKGKGLLTSEEAKGYYELKKKYNDRYYDYLRAVISENGCSRKTVNKVTEREEEETLKRYSKTRQCLGVEEHMEIMDSLYPDSPSAGDFKELVTNWSKMYVSPVIGMSLKYSQPREN